MPTYNMTNLSRIETVGELFTYANTSSNSLLFPLIIWAIFFIQVMALKRFEFQNALLVSSFSCFIIAAIMSYGGFLNLMHPLILLIILAITAWVVFTQEN